MKVIRQSYSIQAPVAEVWRALVNPKVVDEWGGGPAEVSDKPGEPFTLWGGDIYGKNLEVVVNKRLVQQWSDNKLASPTRVEFELETHGGMTSLQMTQSGVPDDRLQDLDDGWREYYLGPLKSLLEKAVY